MNPSHPVVQAEIINRLADICITRILNDHGKGLTTDMLVQIQVAAENIKEVLQQ